MENIAMSGTRTDTCAIPGSSILTISLIKLLDAINLPAMPVYVAFYNGEVGAPDYTDKTVTSTKW